MAGSKQTSTALLTEHFRYTPLTLLDDIINVVNEIAFRAVNAIEEGFGHTTAEQLGFSPSSTKNGTKAELAELKTNEIDNGIVKLESLLNATIDKDFDKFEIYTLRNILAVGHEEDDIANWVRLDHYKGVDLVNAAELKAPTPEAVQLQRRKLQETMKLNIMLKAEEAKNAAILKQLSGLIEKGGEGGEGEEAPFAFLKAAAKEGNAEGNLTQDTQDALERIPALRQLLSQMQEAMQAIPNARHGRYEDEDSAEARRRRYLEHQSRRALERKGIDPDSSAGASLAAGRKMGRDELEGIESVVQALGGASRTKEQEDDEK
ncbi:related to MTW1 Determining metaphase spindle length [Lecanosticta acicola]|uniref:Related to MTW1 Determining metaphase spindle length n=1 Tax=Lecanosticta acicola TaxID=111012 RepID=A0AAI8YX78_9PEZI|nr:related to MTW1 Determining metaphase spindle length [Lecanosticta acicola]